MVDGHVATATKEVSQVGGKEPVIWWRGRCSCGHQTSVKYGHRQTAIVAVERIHIQDITHPSTIGAT